ncbi:MAG TPA: hypothetical protein VGO59_07155 [Verrucomicrobiae bacterium]|jgi:hypothetical protein
MLTPTQNIDLAAPLLTAAQNLSKGIAAARAQVDKHNADKNNTAIDATFITGCSTHGLAIVQALADHISQAAKQ